MEPPALKSEHTLKYNLGCGKNYRSGWVNCDNSQQVRADLVFNLDEFPWPIKSGQAEAILMDNVLEHLSDLQAVMREIYRCLCPGGEVRILVPFAMCQWAFQDPTHKHFLTPETFDYWCVGEKAHYCEGLFVKKSVRLVFTGHTLRNRLRRLIPFKNFLCLYLWNIYDDVEAILQKPL